MKNIKKQIVIIGSSGRNSNNELNKLAYRTGAEIARKKLILITGGMNGIMEAASRGAKENGGITIGITPEMELNSGNNYLDITIPTGINIARNFIVQNSADVIIMIGGSFGTLSELAYALHLKKKIIALKSKWSNIDKSIINAKTPKEAVDKAYDLLVRGLEV